MTEEMKKGFLHALLAVEGDLAGIAKKVIEELNIPNFKRSSIFNIVYSLFLASNSFTLATSSFESKGLVI